jgi:hypothetical protein
MGCGQRGDVCPHAMRHVGGARRLLRRTLPQHMGRGGPAGRPRCEMTRARGIQCPERAAAKARSPGNSAEYNGPPASVGEALSRRYRTRAAGPHCAFARCRAPPWVSPTVSSGAGRAARRPAMPVIGVISAGSRPGPSCCNCSQPVVAQPRSADRARKCLMFGRDRTRWSDGQSSASDPERTSAVRAGRQQLIAARRRPWGLRAQRRCA